MTPQSIWSDFGPDIINALLSGLIAGLVAWLLLRRTQRDEKTKRNEERRGQQLAETKRVAGALLLPIRDLADLMESRNLDKVKSVPTYALRNQIALSEFDLGSSAVLYRARLYVTYVRAVRSWVRRTLEGPAREDFDNPQSSAAQQLAMSRTEIKAYAAALQEHLGAIVDGDANPTIDYPDLSGLP